MGRRKEQPRRRKNAEKIPSPNNGSVREAEQTEIETAPSLSEGSDNAVDHEIPINATNNISNSERNNRTTYRSRRRLLADDSSTVAMSEDESVRPGAVAVPGISREAVNSPAPPIQNSEETNTRVDSVVSSPSLLEAELVDPVQAVEVPSSDNDELRAQPLQVGISKWWKLLAFSALLMLVILIAVVVVLMAGSNDGSNQTSQDNSIVDAVAQSGDSQPPPLSPSKNLESISAGSAETLSSPSSLQPSSVPSFSSSPSPAPSTSKPSTQVSSALPTRTPEVSPPSLNIQQLGDDLVGERSRDYFGSSIALASNGSRIAIGAFGNDDNGSMSGHVRVFDWNGVIWQQIGSDFDGEGRLDQFGYTVALSENGNRIAISNSGTGVTKAGRVQVLEWSSEFLKWLQVGDDLRGSGDRDNFGASVALSSNGNRLIIGASQFDGTGNFTGYARVLEWTDEQDEWQQVGGDLIGEAAGDTFGSSIAMSFDGNRIAIGGKWNDGENGEDSGHVRIFEWKNETWQQVGADLEGGTAGDVYGVSVALSANGGRVAIGASQNFLENSNQSGYARVFEWAENTQKWLQVGSSLDGDGALGAYGISVALSSDGNRLAIGGPENDGSYAIRSGYARIFDWIDDEWQQVGFDVDGEAIDDLFGFRVALSSSGDRVAIGGPQNDGNGEQSGHVRVFEIVA